MVSDKKNSPYSAVLTREQFLFYETRTTAKLLSEGLNKEEVIKQISLLAHEGEVYLVDIYDKLEAVCPPTGEYLAEFEGSEERIQNFDKKYELAYEAYFESKRRKVKDFCIKAGIHYRAVRTDLPLYSQLRPI